MEWPTELRFETSGLEYAAISWGEVHQPVVLALHGWLDNALSFARLGPALTGYRVVAVDLSGHGFSSHRSLDSNYHIWNDVPQLVDIVDELTDQEIIVIGHSRGASVATLLAAALGERCSKLVLIDGLLPAYGDDRNGAHQLARYVRERRKYLARKDRFFASVEEFAQRREQYGFSIDSAQQLAPRALEAVGGRWRLLSDPRLFGGSAVYLNEQQRHQIYKELTVPVLSIFGERGFFTRDGVAQKMLEDAGACIPNFTSTIIDGSHHLHMEEEVVGHVAQRIKQFLSTGQ